MYKQNNLLKICLGIRTKNGKVHISQLWFYRVLLSLKLKGVSRPALFIQKVLSRLRPPVGLQNKQRGASKIKVPAPLPLKQQYLKALRWIFEGAKKRGRGDISPSTFADELYSVAKGKNSYSFKQRKEFLRTVLDSRAFMR